MKETHRQLARHLLAHRSKGYSFRYVMYVSRYRIALSLSYMAVLAFVLWYSEALLLQLICLFVIGMLVGAFLRDFGWLRRLKMNWPFTESVIDWKKVESIAQLEE
ncbi:MAG: hypothetical protein JW993_04270 [Sedimentisphaerales bacterium]|nr:hypothetical protein [Sedimentisphaerales bacterium]